MKVKIVRKEIMMSIHEWSSDNVNKALEEQNNFFNTQTTKNIEFRIKQLMVLKNGVKKYEEKIIKALYEDLGKHENEVYMTEVGFIYHSIAEMTRNLKKWARPKKQPTPIFMLPATSHIMYEPYGAVLIIGPYNYPFQLLIEPLIGAIAAGNTAVLKPSEMSPKVSRVVSQMIEDIFPAKYIRCIEGTIETNTSLLNAKFDYIFFTGSVGVGKIVMTAAARNLIPVTLELGGKSPVLVDESANIKEAARRIIWGKTINAGQTCVAPDFVVVHENVKDHLILEMKRALHKFFGENIEESNSFGRIINERHFNRIKSMIEKDKMGIVFGGGTNEKTLYIEPTIIEASDWKAASMEEEIFGPVLPILVYRNLDKTIKDIRKLPKPLAFYLFTKDRRTKVRVLSEISSGNVCINDTIMHVANSHLPFGGVGNSGMGSYHGRESFLCFSHRKGVLKKPSFINNTLSYPPFTKKQLHIIKKFLK